MLQEIRERVEANERVLITTLTKRMAEQLTDYLADNGVKVRYLHSDIETVERVEILRDLRLGAFDVLVGINLLREGLDIPEVSLVAILDADKEGFLRSERSADPDDRPGGAQPERQGDPLRRPGDRLDEAARSARPSAGAARQIAHNLAEGITPRERRQADQGDDRRRLQRQERQGRPAKAARDAADGRGAERKGPGQADQAAREQMLEHARNLEFEKAARVRDQLAALREQAFGAPVRRQRRRDRRGARPAHRLGKPC